MRLFRYMPFQLSGCVATIGNFDGLHLGHQQLLSKVLAKSQQLQLPSLVMSFYPLPHQFFYPQNQQQIMGFQSKYQALKAFGLDCFLCQRFNQAFAGVSAASFVSDFLARDLKVKHLIVGQDFRFGAKATGDINLLEKMSADYGFSIEVVPDVVLMGEKISSTRIRQRLVQGDMAQVQALLGRPFSLTARVKRGEGKGRGLGFPTANLAIKAGTLMIGGVYCCYAHVNGQRYCAVANVGVAPTVKNQAKTVEVHILDFAQDIYGEKIEVAFVHKIRDEKKFPTLAELIAGIKHDIMLAKTYFAKAHDNADA